MLSLTSGLPTSAANPLLGYLDQSDEMAAAHEKAMADWHREQTTKIDRALLEPDTFFTENPVPAFDPDPVRARESLTVAAYLALQNGGKPVTGPIYPEIFRDRIAQERFAGRGAGSDQAFLGEIRREAQERKDATQLLADVQARAAAGAILRETSEAGLDSQSFQLWREEAKGKPGYKPGMDFAYLETWQETQSAMRENLEPYLGPLKQVWDSMQSGGMDWFTAYDQVPADKREQFLASLALLIRSQPAEQQAGLWDKIVKTNSRAWTTAAVDTLDATGQALDFYSQNNLGTPGESAEQALAREASAADARKRRNFIDDITALRDESYDPVKALGFGEKVATGIVSTIPFMASAAVPQVGTAMVFAQTERMLARDFRRDLMQGLDGVSMSDEQATALADTLAPIVAAPYTAIERMQVMGLMGKFPALEKVMAATANRLKGTAARFTGRLAIAATAETIQENTQQILPAITQEIAATLSSEVPGVEWKNGKDGFFDGYWEQTAVTFAIMLPLSIVAGAGGIKADQRARIFAQTPDVHLRAIGIPADGVARIRAAQSQGLYQAEQVIEAEITAETFNPRSEDAKDATQEVAEALQAEKDAQNAATDNGILPRAVRSAEGGWTLYDTATGAEVGRADDWQGAARLATAHANFQQEQDADRIAATFTTYQAAEASGDWSQATGRSTETQLDLGTDLTTADIAAQSAASRARAEAQDRMMGGDGTIARQILGQSSTELAGNQLRTVNRILGGGSVLDVFHEEAHGFRRAARAAGTLTYDDDVAFVMAVNQVLRAAPNTRGTLNQEGKATLDLLPSNYDQLTPAQQEEAIDEAISYIMEAEVVRTRKTGGQRAVPAGVVAKNLGALSRLLGDRTLGKFRSFIAAMREFFGLAIDRAAQIQRGLADGTLSRDTYEGHLAKLLGVDQQLDFEQMARDTEAAILAGDAMPAIPEGDPFSLGRAVVTPTASTRVFEGAEGSPSVIGPASFSIGPSYGIPHRPSEEGPRAFDLGEGDLIPADVYDHPEWYSAMEPKIIRETMAQLRKVRGNPDAELTIYRAGPAAEMNPGDWVSLSKQYARTHADAQDPEGFKVWQANAKASDVRWAMDDLAEFGYFGKATEATDSGIAFSIRAHHGTPHKVDKFTTAKMGTGEGAQAYGWGLYFAESEGVAKQYRDNLGKLDLAIPREDSLSRAAKAILYMLRQEIDYGSLRDAGVTQVIKYLRDVQDRASVNKQRGANQAANDADIDAVNELVPLITSDTIKKTGNLYTVTLKVEDDQLLDWDKPLSEQPEAVKAAIDSFVQTIKDLDLAEIYKNTLDGANLTGMPGEVFYRIAQQDQSPQNVSRDLRAAGIRGIRYLDGNSRGDGAGSYNYVIFDEADIEILEENGQPVSMESPVALAKGDAFSLGSRRLAVLTADSIRRIQDPLRRAQAMERASRKLEELRLEAERLELLAGSKRIKKSLAREASMRQALRQQELENEAYARHWQVLSDDDLTKLRAQPAHALFADPSSPLRGRIQSRTQTIRLHPELYSFSDPAEFDDSEGVSPTVFGGTLTPDLAVDEAIDAGLLPPGAKTGDLWNLLRSESAHVANMKRVLAAAKADLREARTVAKAETNAWLAEQGATQAETYSPRQEILRTLAALDGILSAFPAEIRGKVGGYVQAARIVDGDAALRFLLERLARVDTGLEKYLKAQYDREFRELLDRARPEKDEAGKRPRGKIGADVHALFADLREAMTLTAAETEAEALRLETLAAQEDLTAAQQSHATLQAGLVRLVGDWPRATAARREAAVLEATRVFQGGYLAHKTEMLRQREDRATKRDALISATGKSGSRPERRAREAKDTGTRTGRVLKAGLSLLSFEQIVQKTFGESSPEATMLVDWERRAAHAKADAVQHKLDLLDDLFTTLAGGRFKGEELRFAMADRKTIQVTDSRGTTHDFSQLEAITLTLMARQEDGRRHMAGHVDDQGASVGDWNYDQAFIDAVEDKLTPEALTVRHHLSAQYAAEYDRLNAVFRQLYGVSLPRHAFYSPLTVKPTQAGAGQMLDPVTGSVMTGTGFTPGSLKTRSQTAIAEPDFRDALQTYIAHTKQMEHWIAYAPFTTEAMALINSREVGNSVEAAAGREALGILRSWLDYFALGGTRDAAAHLAANQTLNRMMGRAAAVALVGRVSVLAIQSTQLAAALAEMPATAYLTRLARLFAGRLDWSAALRSDYIQRRKASMPPIVQQAMEGLASSRPNRIKFAARKMGETISGADALFTAGTYAIAYDYHLTQARALNIPDAHGYATQAAERSVDRVAQPVRPGTRSLFEVTGTNPAVRIVWSFASEPRQKLALAAYALGTKKPAGAKARALAVTWLAGGLLASVIRSVTRDLRDDDDDDIFDNQNWDPKRLALSSLTGPFAGIPYLGDLIEAATFKAFREYLPEGNMLSGAERATTTASRLAQGDTPADLEEAVKDAETLLSGAGLFSESAAAAASFSHLIRDLLGIVENATGSD